MRENGQSDAHLAGGDRTRRGERLLRRLFPDGFVRRLLRLVRHAIYIATFLLLDWALTRLADFTLGGAGSSAVLRIIMGIQIGAAVAAAVLFALEFLAVLLEYAIYILRDRQDE